MHVNDDDKHDDEIQTVVLRKASRHSVHCQIKGQYIVKPIDVYMTEEPVSASFLKLQNVFN